MNSIGIETAASSLKVCALMFKSFEWVVLSHSNSSGLFIRPLFKYYFSFYLFPFLMHPFIVVCDE